MHDPTHSVSTGKAAREMNEIRPRLFLVRPAPHDGEAKLERVQAYLLRQLRAAKRLCLPTYVRHDAIGYHSLLIARVLRQKGV